MQPQADDDAIVSTVLALEDRRYAAMMAGDTTALEGMLADGLVYTHSSTRLDDKASFLASIRSGAVAYRQIQREDVRVCVHWAMCAIVTGGARIVLGHADRPRAFHIRFTNTWVRAAGGTDDWRMASWHATPVPAD